MRNNCPSHCRGIDATNHPKHAEPAQVFTSFLPSKHFRKIGEDCWHSSTNPKRRYRSWIKQESNSWKKFEQAHSSSHKKPQIQAASLRVFFSEIVPHIGELKRKLSSTWMQFLLNISLKILCAIYCIQCSKGIVNVPVTGTETSAKSWLSPLQNHGSLLTSVKIHCF